MAILPKKYQAAHLMEMQQYLFPFCVLPEYTDDIDVSAFIGAMELMFVFNPIQVSCIPGIGTAVNYL